MAELSAAMTAIKETASLAKVIKVRRKLMQKLKLQLLSFKTN